MAFNMWTEGCSQQGEIKEVFVEHSRVRVKWKLKGSFESQLVVSDGVLLGQMGKRTFR